MRPASPPSSVVDMSFVGHDEQMTKRWRRASRAARATRSCRNHGRERRNALDDCLGAKRRPGWVAGVSTCTKLVMMRSSKKWTKVRSGMGVILRGYPTVYLLYLVDVYHSTFMMDINFRTLDLKPASRLRRGHGGAKPSRAPPREISPSRSPAVSNALRTGCADVLGDELVRRSGAGCRADTPRGPLALWPTVRDALRQLQHTLAPRRVSTPAARTRPFLLAMADANRRRTHAGPDQNRGENEARAARLAARLAPHHARPPGGCWEKRKKSMCRDRLLFPPVVASLSSAWPSPATERPFEAQRLYVGGIRFA